MSQKKDLDTYRGWHLALAEFVDAWRLIPRVLIAVYCWLLYKLVKWYTSLEPYILEGCDLEKLGEACIVSAPATQHAALITAIVGIAAAIFGLYSNTGRDWSKGFLKWNGKKKPPTNNGSPEE